MLAVMRDPNEPPERRDEMAKAAAPYVHPKLGAYATGGLGRAHKRAAPVGTVVRAGTVDRGCEVSPAGAGEGLQS